MRIRISTLVLGLVAGAGWARAQMPVPPAPPAPPVVPARPAPAPQPMPAPDLAIEIPSMDFDFGPNLDFDLQQFDTAEIARDAAERAREKAEEVRDRVADLRFKFTTDFAQEINVGRPSSHDNEDRLYRRGQSALEGHRWDEALESFSQAAARGGSRADGALYWKAYSLNKLGRRDEAVAAIAELRKSYAASRWLEDAKALELEVKQASGQNVAPDSQSDEELKLMALNGLMQSDPDRALPLLETVLRGPGSPRLKQHAIFVLAQSGSPRAQQLLEQVAKGGGNPDLQLTAIRYIGAAARKDGKGAAMLGEIYAATADVNVKRAVLSGLASARDKDRLMQIARTEKAPDLRMQAVEMLGASASQADLWQLYQAETSTDIKEAILHSMSRGADTDRLLEVARTEKDARLRRSAIQSLARLKASSGADQLVSLYTSEQDPQVKRTIVNSLSSPDNAKALVSLARAEHDPQMKREIVARLSSMKSKEAEDYLMELIK